MTSDPISAVPQFGSLEWAAGILYAGRADLRATMNPKTMPREIPPHVHKCSCGTIIVSSRTAAPDTCAYCGDDQYRCASCELDAKDRDITQKGL